MSNSYKKTPIVNDHIRKITKEKKQIANRKLRRELEKTDGIVSRAYYKKANESWDISDYAWYWTKDKAIKEYENGSLTDYIYKKYPTLKAWMNYWEKCCYRK